MEKINGNPIHKYQKPHAVHLENQPHKSPPPLHDYHTKEEKDKSAPHPTKGNNLDIKF